MFSRTIVRISVVVARWRSGLAAAGRVRAAGRRDREGHAAQPRGAGGGRQARVREGARAAQARAGSVQDRGPRAAPVAARTHIHMGVVIIQGFKNHELGQEAVREGARHRSEHHDHEVAVDARPGRSVRRGEGRRRRARRPAAMTTERGRGTAPAAPARDPAPARRGADAPSSSGFSYHTVSEVKQGSSIVVTVTVEEQPEVQQAGARVPRAGDHRFPRTRDGAGGRRRIPRRDPRVRATSGSSVAYYMEAQDDQGQPGRVARHRDAPARDLVRRDGEAVVAERRRGGRAEGPAAPRSEDRRRGGDRQDLRQPAGRQRLRLHIGHGRGERGHAGGGHGVGRAARAHRARGRLLVEVRRHAVAAGAVPAGHRDDGADR